MDEFKRAQFDGHGNYCPCCDVHPDRCKKSQAFRGRVRQKLKRKLRDELREADDGRVQSPA